MHKSGTVRSNFLIHWTGKCIHRDHNTLSIEHSRKYVELLHDILSEGLWVKQIAEILYLPTPDISVLKMKQACTCFSEIKLSSVDKHTSIYGCLGFGFTRKFVMERNGCPVHYVPGTDQDIVSQHTVKLYQILDHFHKWIQKHPNVQNPKKVPPDSILSLLHSSEYKGFLRAIGHDGELGSKPWEVFKNLRSSAEINATFLKGMSENPHSDHDFKYLDELEWRIPALSSRESPSGVKPPIYYPDSAAKHQYEQRTGKNAPEAFIKFCPSDLKVLILPDSKTRQLAFSDPHDPRIREWFKIGVPPSTGSSLKIPVIATVGECLEF